MLEVSPIWQRCVNWSQHDAYHLAQLLKQAAGTKGLRLHDARSQAGCDQQQHAPIKKSEIEYYAMLSKTGVHHYTGSEPSSS